MLENNRFFACFLSLFLIGNVFSADLALSQPPASAFDAQGARSAIANLQTKLAALNSSQDIATANSALVGLGGWINNAKMSQYSSNASVTSLVGPAQISHNALDSKLKLIPTFVMVSALNTAFNDYSRGLEALMFVNDLAASKKKVDDSLASLGIAVSDAMRLYKEARALIPSV